MRDSSFASSLISSLPSMTDGAPCTTMSRGYCTGARCTTLGRYVPDVDDTPSPLRAFVELKIGDDVCRWVEKQREAEPHLGRRPLARRLRELTGRRIDPVTLTRWCPGSFHEEG